MKSKKSKNKLLVLLNKQTIANLDHWEMVKIAGGTFKTKEDCLETKETCTEKPVPTEVGITPYPQSDKQMCY